VKTKEQRNQGYGDKECEAENLIFFFTKEMSWCFSKSPRITAKINMFGKTEINMSLFREIQIYYGPKTPQSGFHKLGQQVFCVFFLK
jgi:hypothetical protein